MALFFYVYPTASRSLVVAFRGKGYDLAFVSFERRCIVADCYLLGGGFLASVVGAFQFEHVCVGKVMKTNREGQA